VLLYGPWLVIPRTRFLFHMLPVVPFMALGLAAVAYAPVWLCLPVPVGWLRLLPLVPWF
jgi:dolichyl-phosphate-mannose--protein O-mannosyl transferase